MTTGDGRYCALADLKRHGQVTTTNDDTEIAFHINWAESTFDRECASAFDTGSVTDESPMSAVVDRYGWLRITSATRGPVRSVASVKYRKPLDRAWSTLSWDATNNIILPSDPTSYPPRADSWSVRIMPDQTLAPFSTGYIWKWSYTAGYVTIPPVLNEIIQNLAWWHYKMREAPLGKIINPMLGQVEVPLSIPPVIKLEITRWKRKAM